MKRIAVVAVAAIGLLASTAEARACNLPVLTPHVVDPALRAVDQVPPVLPTLPPPLLTRGKLSMDHGCLAPPPDHSCDEIAMFELSAVATDDATPPEKVGYRLSLEAGKLPSGLVLPSDAVESGPGRNLAITWPDSEHAATQFDLRVVAIDAAGNESAPQVVRVQGVDIGCGGAADPRSGIALLTLLLAAYRRRLRRDRGASGAQRR